MDILQSKLDKYQKTSAQSYHPVEVEFVANWNLVHISPPSPPPPRSLAKNEMFIDPGLYQSNPLAHTQTYCLGTYIYVERML